MKHSGKARMAAVKILAITAVPAIVVFALGALKGGLALGAAVALDALWALFALFTLNFFRDPDPRVPTGRNLVLSPAHGKVDVIGTTTEPEFMGGNCQRVSIFLSVIDVHVQTAPVSGRLEFLKHRPGQFLSALKAESAEFNENVLLGFQATDPAGQKIGVRLIAGLIARRIVPWAQPGDEVARGDRISLVQFGSRADVYLPASAKIQVQMNQHVVGGETVLAVLP
jgi:phosphatidylserine decarboxylase